MIDRPNHVIVGNFKTALPAAYTGTATWNDAAVLAQVAEGDFFLLDGVGAAGLDVLATATSKSVQVAYVVLEDGLKKVYKTGAIEASKVSNANVQYEAKTDGQLEVAEIEFPTWSAGSPAPMAVGDRIVVRVLFKDVYELKSKLTKTYEVIYNGTDNATDLATKFATIINADRESRVSATATAETLAIKAKEVHGGQFGIVGDTYVMFNFEASAYYQNVTAYPAGTFEFGADVTYTKASKGSGYFKVVRDAERNALAYRGVTNNIIFPVVAPKLISDNAAVITTVPTVNPADGAALTATYDTVVFKYEQAYRSPDNSYLKHTPKNIVFYAPQTLGEGAATLYGLLSAIFV